MSSHRRSDRHDRPDRIQGGEHPWARRRQSSHAARGPEPSAREPVDDREHVGEIVEEQRRCRPAGRRASQATSRRRHRGRRPAARPRIPAQTCFATRYADRRLDDMGAGEAGDASARCIGDHDHVRRYALVDDAGYRVWQVPLHVVVQAGITTAMCGGLARCSCTELIWPRAYRCPPAHEYARSHGADTAGRCIDGGVPRARPRRVQGRSPNRSPLPCGTPLPMIAG